MARDLHRAWRQVDADATCAAARKLQQVGAHAAADLQQTRAAKLIKTHHARHPRRILRIAMHLDLIEERARAELMFAVKLRPAGILSPLFPRANLLFSERRHHPLTHESYASKTRRTLWLQVWFFTAASRARKPNRARNSLESSNRTIASAI